jgi:hypothetical protein
MKIGIVPTLYGYSAVAVPHKKGWELHTAVRLNPDLKIQLRGQVLAALAEFAHMLVPWTDTFLVSLFWALWGGVALYLRLARYGEHDPKFIILYGWIMFLFFGDGLFALGRYLYQIPNLRRANKIRKTAGTAIWHECSSSMPTRQPPLEGEDEVDYIERMAEMYPEARPFYDEMLTVEDPIVFRFWPLGLLGVIRYLFAGPKIPRPHVVIELGDVSLW